MRLIWGISTILVIGLLDFSSSLILSQLHTHIEYELGVRPRPREGVYQACYLATHIEYELGVRPRPREGVYQACYLATHIEYELGVRPRPREGPVT